jgi:hypothetical protein
MGRKTIWWRRREQQCVVRLVLPRGEQLWRDDERVRVFVFRDGRESAATVPAVILQLLHNPPFHVAASWPTKLGWNHHHARGANQNEGSSRRQTTCSGEPLERRRG